MNNNKKITIVTGTTRDEHDLMYSLSKKLSEIGYYVILLSGYANSHATLEFRRHQINNPHEFINYNFEIYRLGSTKKDAKSLFVRGVRIIFLLLALWNNVKKIKSDYYLFYSTPPFLGILGSLLAKKGRKTVYLAQDIFPDTLLSIKKCSESSLGIKLLRYTEKYIYNNNSIIITITETMKKTIEKRINDKEKILVIRNWSDTNLIKKIERKDNILFDIYNIDRNKFIVSYAGNIGFFQNVEEIVKASIFLKNIIDIEFVIIGDGPKKSEIINIIEREKISNVKIIPMQSANLLSEVYSMGDIEIASVRKGVTRMACPHKIMDIFAAGSVILALMDEDCDMAEIIRINEIGYVCGCFEAKAIANAIIMAYNNRKKLPIMGRKARDYAETISFDKQAEKYAELLV